MQAGTGMQGIQQAGVARVDHDQPGSFAQAPAQRRSKHRVGIGRIGAADQDQVGLAYRVKILGAGRLAVAGLESVLAGGMADTRAVVDVVVAERCPYQLLHQIGFFVAAPAGGNGADGFRAVLRLHPLQSGGSKGNGLVPAHGAPRIVGMVADQRRGHPVRMRGIAPGKAALDAGMTMIGVPGAVRHHADHLLALELGLERAADAAIGTGGGYAVGRLAAVDHRVFHQGGRRTCLDAGAARYAFRSHQVRAGKPDARGKAAVEQVEGKGALDLFAGTHATRTDDAAGWVVGEIRTGNVQCIAEVAGALLAVTDGADAHFTGRVLQLAVAVAGAGQAVGRVVRQVQLHHPAAQARQLRRLGAYHHAVFAGRGARCRRTATALDFHEAHAAGAERPQRIGSAQLGNGRAGQRCRAQD